MLETSDLHLFAHIPTQSNFLSMKTNDDVRGGRSLAFEGWETVLMQSCWQSRNKLKDQSTHEQSCMNGAGMQDFSRTEL